MLIIQKTCTKVYIFLKRTLECIQPFLVFFNIRNSFFVIFEQSYLYFTDEFRQNQIKIYKISKKAEWVEPFYI